MARTRAMVAEWAHRAKLLNTNVNGCVPTGVLQACTVREMRVRTESEARYNSCETGNAPGMTSA
eukprot:5810057-Pleurochrysis_carterae.AAC.1